MNILGDVQYSNTKSHHDYLKPELSVVVSMRKNFTHIALVLVGFRNGCMFKYTIKKLAYVCHNAIPLNIYIPTIIYC